MLPQSVSERLQKRVEDHGAAEEIEELCLDGLYIFEFNSLVNAPILMCNRVEYLSLNQCQVTSLREFPSIPTLLAFQAIGNKLKGCDLEVIGRQLPNLMALALDNNLIEELHDFQILSSMADLQDIEIRGNPVTQINGYRNQIFRMLPQLRIVDCEDEFGDRNVVDELDSSSSGTRQDVTEISEVENGEEPPFLGEEDQLNEEPSGPPRKKKNLEEYHQF